MTAQPTPLKSHRKRDFFIPTRLGGDALPDVVWEVPPPDYEIPDEPMDNTDQFLLADALKDALSCAGRLSETELYGVSLALCAKINGQTVTKAPDWFYVPAVQPTDSNRGSYTPMVEGSLPAVVMEFLSDNRGREYDSASVPPYGKWFFYEKVIKTPFYVIFDSKTGEIEVYQLENGCYKKQAADENARYWLDSMQLYLGGWYGLKEDEHRRMFWLRWWDADGNLLPWRYEQAEREKQAAMLNTAKKLLQAQVEIMVIAQATGLGEAEIAALAKSKGE